MILVPRFLIFRPQMDQVHGFPRAETLNKLGETNRRKDLGRTAIYAQSAPNVGVTDLLPLVCRLLA